MHTCDSQRKCTPCLSRPWSKKGRRERSEKWRYSYCLRLYTPWKWVIFCVSRRPICPPLPLGDLGQVSGKGKVIDPNGSHLTVRSCDIGVAVSVKLLRWPTRYERKGIYSERMKLKELWTERRRIISEQLNLPCGSIRLIIHMLNLGYF